MSFTATEFKAEYAEFSTHENSVIEAKITDAVARVGSQYGDVQEAQQMRLVAHLLSIDPKAEPSARAPNTAGRGEWSKSIYLAEYERVRREHVIPVFHGGD